jgi:hypothetical protein
LTLNSARGVKLAFAVANEIQEHEAERCFERRDTVRQHYRMALPES